jgi:hypothetical protein
MSTAPSKYQTLVTAVTVLRSETLNRPNPLFGTEATEVILADEGGGPFLILKGSSDGADESIRLDVDELDRIATVARKMVEQLTKNIPYDNP